MPSVTEAIQTFLQARKTAANADLVDRWYKGLETQVNVTPGRGEPVAGKWAAWTDGNIEWHNIRLPKNAATDPTFTDYELRFPLSLYAEGIGCTGWDWIAKQSLWFGFDFDALTGHARGVGIDDEHLEKVRQAACSLPYVQVRRSTGGRGVHLYVYAAEIPTKNHTEHAALARCILGMMANETGFDFASQIDACGHVMWIWHRKMSAENRGLEIVKPHAKVLTTADLPPNWQDHVEVVTRRRTKVRINQIAEKDQDPFEALTASRKIVPLDDSHKAQIEALMRSGFTTLWVQDHHLLQTHTCALAKIKDELHLNCVFTTNSEGRDPGTPNCFLFPLSGGAWKVYRFSPGVQESDTWTQDSQGWTTCYFNRKPDLASLARVYRGVEDPDKGGYTFEASDAIAVAARLGQRIDINKEFAGRKVTLRAHKDGRLVVEIAREKGDQPQKDWVEKKTKFIKIFDIKADSHQEQDRLSFDYDNIVRSLITPAREHAGWVARQGDKWVRFARTEIKEMLQSLGHDRDEASRILGEAAWNSWWLVNLPFREEYPAGRQWNLDAAQFKFKPAELSEGETPHHPHWDMIFNHLGTELTPVLQTLPWAIQAGIKTGADYLRAWVACAFRDPFQPTPYLFLFGGECCGKSTLYEALQLLVTKGVVKADKSLTSEFNGELAGAIICAVEEKDIAKSPGALAKIKDYVTSRTLSIRQMRRDCYQLPNTTHWIQTANKHTACPVFPGDTRITMISVPDIPPDKIIAKKTMEAALEQEAPHFLYTLMHLQLPPYLDRLRIPVVTTASKQRSEEESRTPLEEFIDEYCVPGDRLPLRDFYDRFYNWLPASEKHLWSKIRVRREMPRNYPINAGRANQRMISGLAWRQDLTPGEEYA